MMKKLNNSKGITLIALVITIIVLLILAGVAISMLSGENGILKQAAKAKTETEKQSTLEQIKLAAISAMTNTEHKIKSVGELSTALKQQGVKVDKKANGIEDDITRNEDFGIYEVKVNGEVYYIESNGEVEKKPEVVTDVTKLTTAVAEKTIYEDTTATNTTTKQAVIPEGFKISSVETEQKIDTGLVVIAPDNVSEFVWVPVDDINSMYGKDSAGNKLGKLYNFTDKNESNNTAKNWQVDPTTGAMSWTKSSGSGSNREPDIVKDYDNNTSYNNGLFTKATLQNEFNEMIKNVGKNKGFYVGRYETSLRAVNSEKIAQSKKGETSATAASNSANMWYGLYQKEKEYSEKNSLTNIVGSSMIWGSQYDQMMIWMQKNGYNVASTTPKDGVSYNDSQTTGKSGNPDVMNNVNDLIGCYYEWTLEANFTDIRVLRGGGYGSYSPKSRYNYSPNNPYDNYSSRLALYVK